MTAFRPIRRLRRIAEWCVASLILGTVAAACMASPGASGVPGASTIPAPTVSSAPTALASGSPAPSGSVAPSASASPSASPVASSVACGVDHPPTGASDLVLRIAVGGGFAAPGVDLTDLPLISVFGDGRVMTEGVHTLIYPGPILATLNVQQLTPAGLRALLDAAAKAGLTGKDASYPANGIADAPTTTFTLVSNGCTHTIAAYALEESISTDGLDQATIDARSALLGFENALVDPPTLVGRANVADAGTYAPSAFRVIVRPATPPTGPNASLANTQPWPLKASLATFGKPLTSAGGEPRCGVVDGADAATLAPAFAKANQETRWASGGQQWTLMVRPLLPDEAHTCA